MSIIKLPIEYGGDPENDGSAEGYNMSDSEIQAFIENIKSDFFGMYLSPMVLQDFQKCQNNIDIFINNKVWQFIRITGKTKEEFTSMVNNWLQEYIRNNNCALISDEKGKKAKDEIRKSARELIKRYISLSDSYLNIVIETLLNRRNIIREYQCLKPKEILAIILEELEKITNRNDKDRD